MANKICDKNTENEFTLTGQGEERGKTMDTSSCDEDLVLIVLVLMQEEALCTHPFPQSKDREGVSPPRRGVQTAPPPVPDIFQDVAEVARTVFICVLFVKRHSALSHTHNELVSHCC